MTLDLLEEARRALIAGDPDKAAEAVTRFHEGTRPLGQPQAARARLLLAELIELAEAGRSGVATARQHLAEAARIASGVAGYDNQGQRTHAGTDRRRPLRF